MIYLSALLIGVAVGLAGAAIATRHRRRRPGPDFDDHTAQAIAVTADEVEQRRMNNAVRRHPAGGAG